MSTQDDVLENQLTELGNRIAAQRRSRGLSVEDVAKATRVSVPTIARIEGGNGGVGSKNLLAVMTYIGLPPVPDDSPVLNQAELPLHPLHMDNEVVQAAIEEAAKLAVERLDELFPGARPEIDGISSDFQGLLVKHLSAMLRGQPHYQLAYQTRLKPLVYSDVDLGREYSLAEGAAGFLVRLIDTPRVLEDGKFRLAHRARDMYTSWEYAAAAVRRYIEQEGHLPGPVRIVSGWWSDGETGVRFTPPAAK
ncbi:hypothetical protein WJ96_05285 [Burkholderia ubonensis]|uniref:HTH cro/C1-type domain-containing protein n=1 Tax=Burkholderia ubonensis TaxID=101571 RepID=A0AAW3MWM0_9BURK|nr:helix-turn-helix domain-containing protein [Burkholderia ubonensis]KVP97985.1 hypothetical protein WJ96_05285 [Burkholderia ubonensis]KVZ92683.1 hypothetical protein WL25_16945 [Burkholderia ubonensis]